MEQEDIDYLKKQNKKRLTRIIISIILYIFGAGIILAFFIDNDNAYMMIVVGVVLCGFYTGLTWGKAAKEIHEENERIFGESYTITDNGIYKDNGFGLKLVFFLIGVVFGIIVTPIRVIIDIVKYNSVKKHLKKEN